MHSGQWLVHPNPALGKQRQVDLCEFETTLVGQTPKATQRNPISNHLKEREGKEKGKERGKGKESIYHNNQLILLFERESLTEPEALWSRKTDWPAKLQGPKCLCLCSAEIVVMVALLASFCWDREDLLNSGTHYYMVNTLHISLALIDAAFPLYSS